MNELFKCHNINDFRKLAKKKLPFPIFHYIDGGADDETTLRRNTESFERCDLIPNVLRSVENIDLSVKIFGKKIDLPFFLSPTALQRLFHHQGELAVGEAAEKFNTFFGISSLSTVSAEDISKLSGPKIFQLYYHKDKELTKGMIDECKEKKFDALALTVDTITGGNRERDLKTGFTSPPRFDLKSVISYATSPSWTLNYLFRKKFDLPFLSNYVGQGTKFAVSVSDYFSTMLDQSMSWSNAEEIRKYWKGPFCLKGIMSVEDAKNAVKIGASAIMISNHGGRQLDGSRSPFDQLSEILDAVGGKIEVICDGGIRRGTHILKALSLGANACSGGRLYLYALAAGGKNGVEHSLSNLKNELERNMKLLGCKNISELSKNNIRFRGI
ncbi:MAG: alpha-hydroxy-acid oxidizing enzyme [Rickettsiales bacterium]|nr:alpha-hydroxy-acid oxidizing enzyme [Rickettsiales bacterium]|tara:strand:- start:858 stop:2012 length:1155 start_codon:yes stop_codon:yes gene_type:complete